MNNHDPYDFCRRYMTEDEYILWKGHPEKGNIFTGREAVMLPCCEAEATGSWFCGGFRLWRSESTF